MWAQLRPSLDHTALEALVERRGFPLAGPQGSDSRVVGQKQGLGLCSRSGGWPTQDLAARWEVKTAAFSWGWPTRGRICKTSKIIKQI